MLHFERDTGNQSRARRQSDAVVICPITTDTPTSIAIPTGADVCLFSATTDFYARALTTAQAADQAIQGNFTTTTAWTAGAGWVLTTVATATTASSDLSETIGLSSAGSAGLIPGQAYSVVFDATRSAGSVAVNLGGTAGTSRSSSATFTETLICGATGVLTFTGTGFTGTIDNVTVTPVSGEGAANTGGGASELIKAAVPEESRTIIVTGKNKILLNAPATSVVSASFYKL